MKYFAYISYLYLMTCFITCLKDCTLDKFLRHLWQCDTSCLSPQYFVFSLNVKWKLNYVKF